MSNKSFQELNLNNGFLFPAAMEDPVTCRLVLECILDLKPLYVIFICNFDPFGLGLYKYTFSMHCEERNLPLNDGVKRIFFSTKGKNQGEVSDLLIDFLGYLNESTDSYVKNSSNDKLKEIHSRITELKKKRDVEARYMHYLYIDQLIEAKEKALKEAEKALKETEGALKEAENTDRAMIIELIEDFAEVDTILERLRKRIEEEKNIKNLKQMLRAAVKSDSLEQFEEKIANLL